jgi:Ca2+-dependent lipid-binding protein
MLINESLNNTVDDEGQKQISSSRLSLNKFKDQFTQRAKTVMTKTPSLTSILTTPPSSPNAPPDQVYWTEICIERGKDLSVKDLNGTSDPYVKVYYGTEEKYISNTVTKNLNPVWNEKFTLFTDDLNIPIYFYIFDHDRIGRDEAMGTAKLDLWRLPFDRLYAATLELEDEKRNDGKNGTLKITTTITPKPVEFRDEVKLEKKRNFHFDFFYSSRFFVLWPNKR